MNNPRVRPGAKCLLREMDAIRGGEISRRLRAYRSEEVTFDDIALQFRGEGIHVSREAVRRYWLEINEEAS